MQPTWAAGPSSRPRRGPVPAQRAGLWTGIRRWPRPLPPSAVSRRTPSCPFLAPRHPRRLRSKSPTRRPSRRLGGWSPLALNYANGILLGGGFLSGARARREFRQFRNGTDLLIGRSASILVRPCGTAAAPLRSCPLTDIAKSNRARPISWPPAADHPGPAVPRRSGSAHLVVRAQVGHLDLGSRPFSHGDRLIVTARVYRTAQALSRDLGLPDRLAGAPSCPFAAQVLRGADD